MIRAVVFDFGNVICRFDNGIVLERLARNSGLTIQELKRIVHDSRDLIPDYEKGLVSSEGFFHRLATLIGLKMSMREFAQAYTDKFTPIPETMELIRSLKGKYRLGLLSNTSELDFEHGIKVTDVFPLFDAVTLSFEVHALKPARELYLDILRKLDVEPSESVYIDDVEENVDAAAGIGMNGVLFRTSRGLEESLRYLCAT